MIQIFSQDLSKVRTGKPLAEDGSMFSLSLAEILSQPKTNIKNIRYHSFDIGPHGISSGLGS